MPTVQVPSAFRFLYSGSARYRAAYGGRGSGKSHSFAQALVLKGAERPLRILCAREIQKSIKDSVKRLIDDKIEACGLGGFYQSTETEIRGKNGTLFLFAGLRTNPESVKSTEGIDVAWVEEANTVSQRSLDLLVPTVRKPGSELWFTWNPRHDTDPVDAMFRKEPPPNALVRQVNWNDNPWFPDVLRQELEWDRSRDPEKYAHVWGGEYLLNSEARVFRNWRVEAFETPSDAEFRFGADWGFAVDPTVLIRCWLKGRTLYVDREAFAVGCEIDATPKLFDGVEGSRKYTITADSARPETVSYMRRAGFKIIPAIKGPGSIEDGVEFLKSFDIVVHPRCKHIADELTLYAYKTDPLTGEILPVLEDKHNNGIDALRYALEALRRMAPKTVVAPSRNPPDLWGRPREDADGWKTV
jgi:phage terminase large subunit